LLCVEFSFACGELEAFYESLPHDFGTTSDETRPIREESASKHREVAMIMTKAEGSRALRTNNDDADLQRGARPALHHRPTSAYSAATVP
jgi:hypothetical protein